MVVNKWACAWACASMSLLLQTTMRIDLKLYFYLQKFLLVNSSNFFLFLKNLLMIFKLICLKMGMFELQILKCEYQIN